MFFFLLVITPGVGMLFAQDLYLSFDVHRCNRDIIIENLNNKKQQKTTTYKDCFDQLHIAMAVKK